MATARSAVACTEGPEVPVAGAWATKPWPHRTASEPSTAPSAEASDQRIAGSFSRGGSITAPHSHAGTAKAAAVTSPATAHLTFRPMPPPTAPVVRVHHQDGSSLLALTRPCTMEISCRL
jgi:hypothetical protein